MKRRGHVLFIAVSMATIIAAFSAAQAATSAQPGSEFDPLVTKSYVDEQIQKLAMKIGSGGSTSGSSGGSTNGAGAVDEQVLNNIEADVRDLTNLIIDAYTALQSLEKQNLELIRKVEALEQGFVVVEAAKGQRIRLGSGSEVLVRSGETKAVSGELGGLADVTSAKDLVDGMTITNQHLLISSRDDGRGINVVSEKAFMIIRGTYAIE